MAVFCAGLSFEKAASQSSFAGATCAGPDDTGELQLLKVSSDNVKNAETKPARASRRTKFVERAAVARTGVTTGSAAFIFWGC